MFKYTIWQSLRCNVLLLAKTKHSKTIVDKAMNTRNVHKFTKSIISSPHIYKPVGPYSQAVLADKTMYVSGVLGLDPSGKMVCGGAEQQTRQVLDNLKQVLEAGGASLDTVVKTTILLNDLKDFPDVNRVYQEYFTTNFPARSTYQVAKLPMDAAVEIEAIALSDKVA